LNIFKYLPKVDKAKDSNQNLNPILPK